MAKGYTTAATVAAQLGVTLTSGQTTQCTTLIGAAEQYIDNATRRSWIAPAITNERYNLTGPYILLKTTPVQSVQSVQIRSVVVGDTLRSLTAGVDYELLDSTTGEVRINQGWWGGFTSDYYGRYGHVLYANRSIALVSYTPAAPVPADIGQAATLIAASWLQGALYPDRTGIKAVQVDRDTRIEYNGDLLSLDIPMPAQAILRNYTPQAIA